MSARASFQCLRGAQGVRYAVHAQSKQQHEDAPGQHVAGRAGQRATVVRSSPKAHVAVEDARKLRLVHDCATTAVRASFATTRNEAHREPRTAAAGAQAGVRAPRSTPPPPSVPRGQQPAELQCKEDWHVHCAPQRQRQTQYRRYPAVGRSPARREGAVPASVAQARLPCRRLRR